MPYKTVIFDWDGCLSMTLEVWVAVYKEALKSYDIHLKDDQVVAISGDWASIEKLGITDVGKFRHNINKQMATRFPEIPLYPGAKSILNQLRRQGVNLGLVTSSERSDISRALTFHEIEDLFDSIVCGDDVKNHKPHPESIIRAIKELKALPNSTIMIGDSDKDIVAAAKAKIDSMLIFHESHTRYHSLENLQLSGPTHTLYSFGEVTRFMELAS